VNGVIKAGGTEPGLGEDRKEVFVRRPQRITVPAFSLLEVVISSALLAGVFLLFSTMFGQALRGTAKAGEMSAAVNLANARLAELHSIAATSKWSDLLAQDGREVQKDGFRINTRLFPRKTFSPNETSEAPFVTRSEDRSLEEAAVIAQVTVEQGVARTTQARLLRRPPKELGDPPIRIGGIPASPLSRDEEATITAELLSADGEVLPALFSFHLIPGTGSGTLRTSRSAREATFQNLTRSVDGTNLYTGGNCRIRAKTTYQGRSISVESPLMDLSS